MATFQTIIVGALLGIAVATCLLCAIGLVVARDAYQRLQFCTPLASIALPLIAMAICIAEADWQSRLKSVLIAAFVFVMNAVIGHATARSLRIREIGHWPPVNDEQASQLKQ